MENKYFFLIYEKVDIIKEEICKWEIDPEKYVLEFKTTCGNHHHLIANDGQDDECMPPYNFKFCPFCSKKLNFQFEK